MATENEFYFWTSGQLTEDKKELVCKKMLQAMEKCFPLKAPVSKKNSKFYIKMLQVVKNNIFKILR